MEKLSDISLVTGLKDAQTAMALQEAEQVSGEDFSGDWGERHEDELTDGQAQQTSGEDFSGDWGERHDGELGAEGQAQQTSGEPDAAQEQPVQYTDLPLDAEVTGRDSHSSKSRHSKCGLLTATPQRTSHRGKSRRRSRRVR